MTGFSPGRELAMYRTQGLDVQISVKALAGCGHPRRGTNYTRNGISCKECAYATQQEKKKQRRKLLDIKDLHARNDASYFY
jgi:hypothetical protein